MSNGGIREWFRMESSVGRERRLACRSVPLLPPADPEEVRSVFKQLGSLVSKDVLRLYATTGGFPYYVCDNVWSLWRLNFSGCGGSRHESRRFSEGDSVCCGHPP